jgi:hypothetical protein
MVRIICEQTLKIYGLYLFKVNTVDTAKMKASIATTCHES